MKINERVDDGVEVRSIMKLGILPGTDVSRHAHYLDHWEAAVKKFNKSVWKKRVSGRAKWLRDFRAFSRAADSCPYWPWIVFAGNSDDVQTMLSRIETRWGAEKLAGPPAVSELRSWAEVITRNASRPDVLFRAACDALEQKETQRAQNLYRAALERRDQDGWKTALANSEAEADGRLNILRLALKGDLGLSWTRNPKST